MLKCLTQCSSLKDLIHASSSIHSHVVIWPLTHLTFSLFFIRMLVVPLIEEELFQLRLLSLHSPLETAFLTLTQIKGVINGY